MSAMGAIDRKSNNRQSGKGEQDDRVRVEKRRVGPESQGIVGQRVRGGAERQRRSKAREMTEKTAGGRTRKDMGDDG